LCFLENVYKFSSATVLIGCGIAVTFRLAGRKYYFERVSKIFIFHNIYFLLDISDVCNKGYKLAKCVLWHYFEIDGDIVTFMQEDS
jgi:hypothetical protein